MDSRGLCRIHSSAQSVKAGEEKRVRTSFEARKTKDNENKIQRKEFRPLIKLINFCIEFGLCNLRKQLKSNTALAPQKRPDLVNYFISQLVAVPASTRSRKPTWGRVWTEAPPCPQTCSGTENQLGLRSFRWRPSRTSLSWASSGYVFWHAQLKVRYELV